MKRVISALLFLLLREAVVVVPRSYCCRSKKLHHSCTAPVLPVAVAEAEASAVAETAGKAMAELEREVLVNWVDGDCVFRMSVPINGGPPSPRPKITGDLILIVDRCHADGRRHPGQLRVFLPIRLLDATRLAFVPSAREDGLHEVVEAWSGNSSYGSLPNDLVLELGDVLSAFFRDVAWEMDPGPDITYVSAVARVRLFDAGRGEEVAEEEGDAEEVAMEEDGDDDEVAEEEEQEVGNGEEQVAEGEEETRCAICLAGMASSGSAAEGRRERCWLPCCHSFHRGCLERWLRQKAECPLCRAPAAASAANQQHSS